MLTITDSRAFLVIALLASMTSLANAQDELAKSPQELLQRLDKSVKSKDLSRLQTCIPRQVDDKSKAAARSSSQADHAWQRLRGVWDSCSNQVQ